MTRPRPLVAGNWKMNGTAAAWSEAELLSKCVSSASALNADVMLCPPATLIARFAQGLKDTAVLVGAQDCHAEISGAHTGDISAEMMRDAGAVAIIVGHSERRADHGETDAAVNAKAQAVHRAGLQAIICVGETESQRRNGETLGVVGAQVEGSLPGGASATNTIVAYEPVWAIGTGLTPTTQDVADVHAHIRQQLSVQVGNDDAQLLRILYGGSVKAANARELMAVENVDGALVGGASLKAADFWGIISVYAEN